MVVVILMMGLQLGNEHKERLFTVVIIDVFKGKVVYAVGSVSRKINFISVFVENISVITVGRKFQNIRGSPILVAPLFFNGNGGFFTMKTHSGISVRGKMPFSYIGGVVTVFVKVIRQSARIFGEGYSVPVATAFRSIKPRLKTGAGRTAHGLTGEGI